MKYALWVKNYEYSCVIGVFSTKSKAMEARESCVRLARRVREDDDFEGQIVPWDTEFRDYCWPLDDPEAYAIVPCIENEIMILKTNDERKRL